MADQDNSTVEDEQQTPVPETAETPADKSFAERMQRSIGPRPVSPVDYFYTKDPEIAPFESAAPPAKDVPFYGEPSEKAITAGPITFYDPQKGAPAIFGEPTEAYEPFSMFGLPSFGIEIKTEQTFDKLRDIDYSKMSSIASVGEVYNLSNPEEVERINRQTGIVTRDGNKIPFPPDSDINRRIKLSDQFGAVAYFRRKEGADDVVTKIPWEAAITNLIQAPEDFAERQLRIPMKIPGTDLALPPTQHQRLMGFDKLMLTVPNYAEPDLRMTEALKAMSVALIEQSENHPELKDARTRFQILEYARATDFANGMSIIPEYGRTAARFAFEFGGWAIGESVQALSQVPAFISDGNIPAIPNVGIFDSQARQEAITTILPRHADELQRRMLNNGIDISYGAAEYLSRYSMGLPPRLVGNAVEIIMPTALASKAKAALSTADYAAFKLYRENAIKAGRADTDSFNFLQEFINENKASFVSRQIYSVMSSKSVNKVLAGRPAKWARVGIVDRLNAGKNIDEITNLPLERRTEYNNILNIRNNSIKTRDDINARIANENRAPTPGELLRIEKAEARIKEANIDLLAETAAQNVPQFMRTVAEQNKYFVIGASVGGQFTQAIGGDPALGEGIGMISGLVVMGGTRVNKALKWVKSTMPGAEQKKIDLAEFAAQGINTFDPEYSEAILTRVGFLRELRDEMIAEGVTPENAQMSIGQLTGLAVLQSLDATTRQNISAKQLKKMGPEVQELIDIHSVEKRLVEELRLVYSNMRELDYPEGTAANRMQKLLAEAIDWADADITQREADFNDLISATSAKVTAMIGDSMGKSLYLTDLQRTEIEQFDTMLSRLVDIGVELGQNTIDEIEKIAEVRTSAAFNIAEAKANEAIGILSDVSSGQRQLSEVVPEDGFKTFGRNVVTKQEDIPRFGTGYHIQSAVYEIKHVRDREQAAAGFRVLDRKQFLDGNGNVIGSEPYVDGGQILDSLVQALEIDSGVQLLDFVTGKTVSPSAVNASVATLDNKAREFFELMADEGEDVGQTIKNAVELAADDPGFSAQYKNLSSLKGNKDALIAAVYQRHIAAQQDTAIDTLKISFTALRRFDSMFKELGYRATSRGNAEAAKKYEDVGTSISALFNDFVVDDAAGNSVPVGQLSVQLEEGADPVLVMDALRTFNQQWTDYKATWFDNAEISRQMAWGDRNALTPTPDNPLGFRPKNKTSDPRTWFNFNSMSADNIGATFESYRNAIGTPMEIKGGARHIDPDSDVGRASVAALKVQVGEWIRATTQKSDFDLTSMDETLKLIETTFVGVNSKGETVPLMPEIGRIIDDTMGIDSGAVNAQVLAEARKAEDAAVKAQTSVWNRQKDAYTKDMNSVIGTLRNFLPGKTSPAQLIFALSEGGPQLVGDFRSAMKRTKKADGSAFTDEDIDVIMGDMAVEAIETSVFPSTGRYDADPRNPDRLIPQYAFNADALADFIGYNDPSKARVIESAMGTRRYKVATRMLEFIRNKENTSLGGLSVSGIPRSFSVESYISRFYAINRDVIGPQYVATESILQRMRQRNFSIVQAALTDPKVGELFLEMLESGKPLPPAKEKELQGLLVAASVKLNSTLSREQSVGREDIFGMPGWKVRQLTEEPYGDSMFPYHPEYNMEFIKRIPLGRPLP